MNKDPPKWLLNYAIRESNLKAMKWCYANLDPDVNDWQTLKSIDFKNLSVLMTLLDMGLNLTKKLFDNHLCWATKPDLKIVDLLLDMGCPYTDESLYSALKWGNVELYLHLIDKGVKWSRTTIDFTYHIISLLTNAGLTVPQCIYHDIYDGPIKIR